MASAAADERFFRRAKHFPTIVDGRINVVDFLAASDDLVELVGRLGTLFTPVKVDMARNTDKIKKLYKYDESSCLLELMLEEIARGKPIVAEGILWLNRALLFFELIFMGILHDLKLCVPSNEVNMKKVFVDAYEGSVKKYHNWFTQQTFEFICKMSSDLPKLLASLDVDDIDEYTVVTDAYNAKLHLIRSRIDDFFNDNNIV